MTRVEELRAELKKAEAALHASEAAMRTHGHQASTWAFLKADAQWVHRLRLAIAKAEKETSNG